MDVRGEAGEEGGTEGGVGGKEAVEVVAKLVRVGGEARWARGVDKSAAGVR